jgi:hypothetical protein
VVIFMGQAAFCRIISSAASPPVNDFYKDLTTLHILAMSLTFPVALLLRVMPVPLSTVWGEQGYMLFGGSYSRAVSYGHGRDGAYPTAASYAFLSLLILFSLHSVSNCCRLIFDACGERAAKHAVIPAALCQLWLLWPPLTFTFSLQMAFSILIAIDYIQHLAGCTYWASRLYLLDVAAHAARAEAVRDRAFYGVCGGVLHILSAGPLVSFHISAFQTDLWVLLLLVGLAVCLMASAQTCWIKMALLTPQAATRPAVVHEPTGGPRVPSPRLPRVAMRRAQTSRQNERSYHPEPRLVQSSTAVDAELAAGKRSQLAAAEPRSFVHTDFFSLPQTTPDYIPNYPDDLVVVPGTPPSPSPPPPPPAPLPAPPGGEVDVWAGAHSEQDVWAEAQTEQGETYYYHVVTGETTWERHYVL